MLSDESGSDGDILEYVSDSESVNVRPILQSSHRSKAADLDVVGGHQVRCNSRQNI